MAMNVSLTPELEKFVEEKVKSGMYNSASEVVRQALRLLRRQEEVERIHLEKLRAEIQLGIDDADAGRTITLEELKRDIKARRAARPKQSEP
jgi:antitoxin ParD1/3/4